MRPHTRRRGSRPRKAPGIAVLSGGPVEPCEGALEPMKDGHGFIRSLARNFIPGPDDVLVPQHLIRQFRLKIGSWIVGEAGKAKKRPIKVLTTVHRVDGLDPAVAAERRDFKDLTSTDPDSRFVLDNGDVSTRLVDLLTPLGRGQRALIVAAPRTGKTILLQKIAHAITSSYPDVLVTTLLVDERPEEVTDWRRATRAEVVASSFDEMSASHVRVAEIVTERAKRQVEVGKDVVILMDSLTRLGRAYNLEIRESGRILSGGIDARTLEKPKAFFGAARKVEGGGSLTIVATAIIETGSRMDQVIFEEFKGTGNMELVLSRKLADQRVFPAIDILLSGTRKEEKLIAPEELRQVWALRRVLHTLDPLRGMKVLIEKLSVTKTNRQFLSAFKI